ncbi:UNVERIFIED_CONTAM: Pectinesterase 3 [Sesamum radiatum]|uniref:Pectinesterase n=1 Tax=Sesamum radiatum TaxID=300843 RepID=A0AAW2KN98_SESRA
MDSPKSAKFDGTDEPGIKTDEPGTVKSLESVEIFECVKNDEFEEEEYRRKTRKRLIIIAVSSVILVLIIIGAIIGILVPMRTKNLSSSLPIKSRDSIKEICNSTLYQDSCYSSIYSLKMSSSKNSGSNPDSPEEIFMLSLQVTLNELVTLKSSMSERLVSFRKNNKNDSITQNALDNCENLIQDAVNHVSMSMSSMQQDKFSASVVSDIKTWLSTAITDQQTCLDGLTEFENISVSLQGEIKPLMENATEFTSNSLAIISNIFTIIREFQVNPAHRKLLQENSATGWMHWRLLKAEVVNLRPNLTVAKDGTGDYQTISEAVNALPKRSNDRFLIYVKEGEYEEQVVVDSDSWNVMIYGDGMNKTIVSGSLNHADGVATYNSGTLIAEGRGFIARDISFKNTAGPAKLQAVALRSSSDKSIFFRCSIDGYQDTLYVHSNRQFYAGCLITGTIDFIFGNAAAVFQNCSIQPRQPDRGQYNTVTAQSKSDPNQNTGISIQQCSISPCGNLTAQTFLGRPWNNYSTTVIMETDIQGIIDPAGWIPWEPGWEAPDTIFYAEYKNTGPGSVLNQRVTWPGYRPNITEEEAEKFYVEPFIQGNQWLIRADVRI